MDTDLCLFVTRRWKQQDAVAVCGGSAKASGASPASSGSPTALQGAAPWSRGEDYGGSWRVREMHEAAAEEGATWRLDPPGSPSGMEALA